MKRKVNRVGQNTLTVSLPSEWARRQNVKAGDEINVIEEGLCILIDTTSKRPPTEIVITIGDFFLNRLIYSPYLKGYDKIIVRYNTSQMYSKILEASRLLMGFEIVDHADRSCALTNIATQLEKSFESVVRQLFMTNIICAKELLISLENGTLNAKEIYIYEENMNRLSLFCKRLLQKNNTKGQIYSSVSLYCIISYLEKIGDCFRWIVDRLGGKQIQLSKTTNDLFKDTIHLMEINFEIFKEAEKSESYARFRMHKELRDRLNSNALMYLSQDIDNMYICTQLLEVLESSFHMNYELFK